MPVQFSPDMSSGTISISIVSHGHKDMVEPLVSEVLHCPEIGQVLVTKNIPESLSLPDDSRVKVLENPFPMGFAANQNAAFAHCFLPYFCPLNPDIQLHGNPFPNLLAAIATTDAAIAAPLVTTPSGSLEDSIRPFPTLRTLFAKAIGISDAKTAHLGRRPLFFPEWVAGMFMLFRSDAFRQLGGFDPHFFLYYEDVDICVRAWKAGMQVVACGSATVVHDARRESHHNLRYMSWHLASMTRYFCKHWGRLPRVGGQP